MADARRGNMKRSEGLRDWLRLHELDKKEKEWKRFKRGKVLMADLLN
jgi:hypothetical protein